MSPVDQRPLRFGKYKGLTPAQISMRDPGYIVWIHTNIPKAPCSDELARECVDCMRDAEGGVFDDEFGEWGGS